MAAHAKAHDANEAAADSFLTDDDAERINRFQGSFSGYERDAFFVGQGPGKPYVEAAFGHGLDHDTDGRAVAPLDIDGDGDLDLVRLSIQTLQLLRNETDPTGGWIRMRLVGTKGHPLALGATVTVRAGGHAQMDHVSLTKGFHTQVNPMLHFGLGAAETADVEIRWPDGQVERHAGLSGRHLYVITQGGKAEQRKVPSWPAGTGPQGPQQFSLAITARPYTGGPLGPPKPLGTPGRPTVVNFWAPWCEACKTEMPALIDFAKSEAGKVAFVGVSVETKDLAGVGEFLARYQVPYPQRIANDDVVHGFFGKAGQIPLPATFVFDAEGQLVRAFYREVDQADLRATLAGMARTLAPNDLLTLADKAIKAKRRGDLIAVLRELEAAAPDDPGVRLIASRLYFQQGMLEDALRQCDASLKDNVQFAEALAFKAAILGAMNQLDEAEAAANAALAINPKHPDALNNLGMVHLTRGDRAAAKTAFEAALAADPQLERARKNLAQLTGGSSPPPGPGPSGP